MDAAAVLILGTAKCEGEISAGQKHVIRPIFEQEFRLDSNTASDLLLANTPLIRDEIYLVDKLEKILEYSSTQCTPEQATSLLSLMTRVGTLESTLNGEQRKLIAGTELFFERLFAKQQAWKPDTRTW